LINDDTVNFKSVDKINNISQLDNSKFVKGNFYKINNQKENNTNRNHNMQQKLSNISNTIVENNKTVNKREDQMNKYLNNVKQNNK